MTSRAGNAFADPNAPTVADLLASVDGNPQLSPRQQREICSALKALARWFRLPPEAIPANLSFLRRKLAAVHPATAGISERRVQNVRSLVLKAFRVAGLPAVEASYLCPMTPAWQRLYDLLPSKYERWALGRFMRFCSAQGIAPIAVCDDIFQRFLEALVEETLVRHPKRDHQTACRLWNKACREVEGWPDIEVTVPRYQETYGVDWSLLDPTLIAEIETYLDCLAKTDPFQQDGLARPLRPTSLKAVRGSLQRYLGALERTGVDITQLRSLEQLVDFELFKQAIGWLWRRNDQKTSRGLESIAWTVRCIAIKRCKVDEETTAKYVDAIRTLRVEQHGLSDKNDALLQRFDDRDLVRRFLNVPLQLWADAERRHNDLGPHKAALLVQVAIAIEILQFAPMRASNLVQLDLEKHLNWLQDGREQVLHITLPAEEVKNRERLHFYLPADASRRIRLYLERWRPLLVKGPNRFLFPGRGGGCKDQSCLSRQVTRAIWKYAGARVTPHQLRHIAAKLLLDHCPGAYEAVRRLLGHKHTSTTYEHYCGRETKTAAEHYNTIVLGLRSPTAPQERAGRRSMTGKRTQGWRRGGLPPHRVA